MGTFKNNTIISTFEELQYFTSITQLNQSCFEGCTQLTKVIVPEHVSLIYWASFRYNPNLLYIKILATSFVSLNGGNGFHQTNDCPIYVPDDLVETYKSASYWSQYASRIKGWSDFPG